MLSANLYLDKINLLKYLNKEGCTQCGFLSCEAFLEALKSGAAKSHECSCIERNVAYAFKTVDRMKDLWPQVPIVMQPRPGYTGLMELNRPTFDSLVLITGNNEYTEEVLMTVLATTLCPFYVLFVDTDGNTLDMSMVYKTFTAQRILRSLTETGMEESASRREIIIPGLAFYLEEEIEKLTGWCVSVGPVCAAELPLFLSEVWIPP